MSAITPTGQEHRGGHLGVRVPGVSAVAHPGDHRDGHHHGHAEQREGGRVLAQLCGAAADRAENGLAGQAEDQHAQEHRRDHLGVVADEVGGGRGREAVEVHVRESLVTLGLQRCKATA
jgi:hypothetical protein